MSQRELTIALLQGNFRSSFDEKAPHVARVADLRKEMTDADFRHNVEKLKRLARDAAARGAQLAVAPESFVDGWSARAEVIERIATKIPGPFTDELGWLCRETKLWLCAGIFERAADKIYNSAVLIAADGSLRGVYRKTHETRDVLERMPYALGDALPVFDSPWGKLGILICHDRWYPENGRALARRGAKIVLNPTATAIFHPAAEYFEIHRCVLRSQAYLNQLWWVSCNAGNHGGHSVIVNPRGDVVAAAGDGEEVSLSRVDLEAVKGYDFRSNVRHDAVYARGEMPGTPQAMSI